jgi:hypothetical protein
LKKERRISKSNRGVEIKVHYINVWKYFSETSTLVKKRKNDTVHCEVSVVLPMIMWLTGNCSSIPMPSLVRDYLPAFLV